MSTPPQEDITLLLAQAAKGNQAAAEAVFEALYGELRRLAMLAMRNERAEHTLQPTALVHEAYLRLAPGGTHSWESRAHFLNAAARAMRRILIDHARAGLAAKRPQSAQRVELADHPPAGGANPETVLAINDALQRLETFDPRQARVVELRYFGGLGVEETARILNVSDKTVKRDWAMARAWLEGELRR